MSNNEFETCPKKAGAVAPLFLSKTHYEVNKALKICLDIQQELAKLNSDLKLVKTLSSKITCGLQEPSAE